MSSICKPCEWIENDNALAASAATVSVECILSTSVDSCSPGYQVTGGDSAVASRDGNAVNALFERLSSYRDWPRSFAMILPYVEEPLRRSVSWLAGADSVSA